MQIGGNWVCYMFDLLCIIKSSLNYIQDYESKEKFPIRDDRISHLLPASYQDLIVRVYSKKPELVCNLCYRNLISLLHFLSFLVVTISSIQCTGWSNLWGFWKFPVKNIWDQGTGTSHTREKETASFCLAIEVLLFKRFCCSCNLSSQNHEKHFSTKLDIYIYIFCTGDDHFLTRNIGSYHKA